MHRWAGERLGFFGVGVMGASLGSQLVGRDTSLEAVDGGALPGGQITQCDNLVFRRGRGVSMCCCKHYCRASLVGAATTS